MGDLVIREEDGWIEISGLLQELSREALRELWGYAGKGDVDEAEAVLDMEAGSELEELIGTAKITAIRVVSVPDDVLGERLRAWVQAESVEEPPPPQGEAEDPIPVDIERELDMARNVFGRLKPQQRTRLRAVIYQPTEKTWDDAHGIIVGADGWTTLWQAVIAIDPTFPKVGPATTTRGRVVERWKKIPSQETLLKALRYATH